MKVVIFRATVRFLVSPWLSVLLLTAGCATFLDLNQGPPPNTFVSTMPNGEVVEIRNKSGTVVRSGVTPFTVRLPPGKCCFNPERYTFRNTSTGYEVVFRSELPRRVTLSPTPEK